VLAAGLAGAEEKALQLKDLPPAARRSAEEMLGEAKVVRVRAEAHEGRRCFVLETTVEARRLETHVDEQGLVLEIREELALTSVPPVPRAALEGQGRVLKVHSVMRKGGITYEAQVESAGKVRRVVVGSDGKPRPGGSS
jgi:alkanesulfonate monooxygenase SsuD/methylene tetrahydromethanopterin reductase-like flavin-dependent oxidoreductase (luciferase family)